MMLTIFFILNLLFLSKRGCFGQHLNLGPATRKAAMLGQIMQLFGFLAEFVIAFIEFSKMKVGIKEDISGIFISIRFAIFF
jgi:hypothetical protein